MKLWKRAVQVCLTADVSPLIWGDPGIGKTSFMYALAKALNWHAEVVIASIREPSDFLGLPMSNGNGSYSLLPPKWATSFNRLEEMGKEGGMVVFDELSTAPPAVQHALLRVMLEGVVGDYQLPKGVRTVGIANPSEQVGGWELTMPLNNRFCHIEAGAPSAEEWSNGMVSGWHEKVLPLPSGEEVYGLIGGFHRAKPGMLHQIPKENAADQRAWPSPRSWEMAGKLLSHCPPDDADLQMTLLRGVVGEGPGIEFATWLQNLDLPDPKAVLAKGARYKFPTARHDKCFVILDSVTRMQMRKLEKGADRHAWDQLFAVYGAAVKQRLKDLVLCHFSSVSPLFREGYEIPDWAVELREFLGL